jgi:hypothetical protein
MVEMVRNALWMSPLHFVLGFFVGWLVYWSTLTILSHLSFTKGISGSFIHTLALLLALSVSVLAHLWEDYTLNIF